MKVSFKNIDSRNEPLFFKLLIAFSLQVYFESRCVVTAYNCHFYPLSEYLWIWPTGHLVQGVSKKCRTSLHALWLWRITVLHGDFHHVCLGLWPCPPVAPITLLQKHHCIAQQALLLPVLCLPDHCSCTSSHRIGTHALFNQPQWLVHPQFWNVFVSCCDQNFCLKQTWIKWSL